MNRQLISSGSSFEREIGYSRAVVDGDWIFVSGTTGFDYRSFCRRAMNSRGAGRSSVSTSVRSGPRLR
jgi:enamine deaminase RidA (YjgF/YER057c/UK114 family)